MSEPGAVVELDVERPVAGGAMLARLDGEIVLVSGAIPGERVRARVSRRGKRVATARVVDVLSASPDRRDPPCDPACGGSAYAYIAYARQLALKAEIVADAFRRIARMPLDGPLDVRPSRETGYRLRAMLHARGGRVGFFREGTHQLCDAAPTGQLLPGGLAAAVALAGRLGPGLDAWSQIVVAENVAATERLLHLVPRGDRLPPLPPLDDLEGVTGVTTVQGGRLRVVSGTPIVGDAAADVFGEDPPVSGLAAWTRHATSFFQGNRWLLGALLRRVLDVAPGDRIVDLYSGVGLFAVALAARGASVVAVEGDRSSGADLAANAGPWRERLLVVRSPVEDAVAEPPAERPDAVIVDPPRTGLSTGAIAGLIGWRAPRLVYVSCDPATLARDAARLADAGYRLDSLDGFDLFPNTAHVETVAVFTLTSSAAPRTPSGPAPA